ncbi:transposase [Mordavella massiliensis]|uniref:transposase n=1 Tax=Mordavella massiliensis TaxID=1871024 RepID=UPI003709755C
MRSTIYTTNVIESFNKQLKRQIDKKEQFPNENALDRFVMTQVATYNDQNVSGIRRTCTIRPVNESTIRTSLSLETT